MSHGGLQDSINIVGFFHKIRYDAALNICYAADSASAYEDGIVQLSTNGSRQFDVPGFIQVA